MVVCKVCTYRRGFLFAQQWKQALKLKELSTFCKQSLTEELVRHRILDNQNHKKMIEQILKFKNLISLPDSSKKMVKAGVYVPFCIVDGKLSVLLTRRSPRLSFFSGHVSFPGGRMDEKDKSIVDAVLRETNEELGIPISKMDVWLECAPFADRSGKTLVTPVIGYLGELDLSSIKPNYEEVSSVFAVPLTHLLCSENQRYTLYRDGLLIPVFTNCSFPVWGIAATVLDSFLAIVFPDYYKLIARQKEGALFSKHKKMISKLI